jgi:Sen15 protein
VKFINQINFVSWRVTMTDDGRIFLTSSKRTSSTVRTSLTSPLTLAQRFRNVRRYSKFHHPILTALPPVSPLTPHPTDTPFFVVRTDEKVSTKLFVEVFDWMEHNVWHPDPETGGFVKERWTSLVIAIVHPDSTVAYYKVHDGIHKPLEGTAGV